MSACQSFQLRTFLVPYGFEGLQQGRNGQGCRGLHIPDKTKRKHAGAAAKLPQECYFASSSHRISPGHSAIDREILPTVADADESGTCARPCIALRIGICRGEGNGIVCTFGPYP